MQLTSPNTRQRHAGQTNINLAKRHCLNDRSRTYGLQPQEITLVNPNTGTCPTFKTARDAEITIGIYKRIPVLWREDPEDNPWKLSQLLMFMTNIDSRLFRTSSDGDVLALYEGKMVYHFDHRFGDYRARHEDRVDYVLPRTMPEQKAQADFTIEPRYWID